MLELGLLRGMNKYRTALRQRHLSTRPFCSEALRIRNYPALNESFGCTLKHLLNMKHLLT